MTVKLILTDIEGTTSSIAFVKDVLFPYAAEHLSAFINSHQQQAGIRQLLEDTARLAAADGETIRSDDTEGLIRILQHWIATDRKATPLKTLQGLIWRQGYEQGDYQAHMYPDATECLQRWHRQGIPLYVYSSGSVEAQKLFYGHSCDGNLLPLFSGHFDTHIGGKRDAESYRHIVSALQQQHDLEAGDILFLSDIREELDAARTAGLMTCWLIRDGELPEPSEHPAVSSFHDIAVS